ncbi:MAG TPA: hypothetical protein VHM70_28090 [Polyangiaceae bacterium]|nr:hypothetical protein [Polyangiaceae bacterium]
MKNCRCLVPLGWIAVAASCTGAQGKKGSPAAAPDPVAQSSSPGATSETPVASPPDAGGLSNEERLAHRKQRWQRALDTLQNEPIDVPWATQTAAAIDNALTVRLKHEERLLVHKVECHTTNCVVQVTAPASYLRSLSFTLRARVVRDLHEQGYAPSLSLVTSPESSGNMTIGYYYFTFVRK